MGEMSRREDERLKKHQQGAMEGKVTKHKLTCSLTHIGLLFLLSHTHTDTHTHTDSLMLAQTNTHTDSHTFTHTRTHTDTHTHTLLHTNSAKSTIFVAWHPPPALPFT